MLDGVVLVLHDHEFGFRLAVLSRAVQGSIVGLNDNSFLNWVRFDG